MLIRDLKDCEEFIAGDGSIFRELIHPDKHEINGRFSLGLAIVKPGIATQPHKLKTSEFYYIQEGEGEMNIDGEVAKVLPGQIIYIPPQAKQFIKNIAQSDLKFLCIVDPAWQKEDEEIL